MLVLLILLFQQIQQQMKEKRNHSSGLGDSFIKTLHNGFNYFAQINFESQRKAKTRSHARGRFKTSTSFTQDNHKSLIQNLEENQQKFAKIKTEISTIRDYQFNDYIKKSTKYQQLLNINDNKKKRLPTLNAKVGEVVKKSNAEEKSKKVFYELTTTSYRLEGWKPQSREGHTTIIYKNMAIIIGGHCSYPFLVSHVYSFDIHNWVKQFNSPSARSYHSSILYKNRFIITFGGMGAYDVSRKCRVCYNTINLIDLQSWTSRTLKMSNEETIQGRRSHTANLLGKYMLVFGGMNTKRQFLKDFIYLDMKQLRWYQKQYKIQGKELNENMEHGLAKHKSVSTFKASHKNYPLYSSQYSDSEGILMFGGNFGNGEQNIVIQMSFNKYNPVLRKIDYTGIPPSSTDPIIDKFSENIVIIVSGEQNQRIIKIYKIKEREFVGISKCTNQYFFGGIGSSMVKYQNDFYLFFGLGSNGYIGNVNSFNIEQKVTENEISKKKKERSLPIGWKDNLLSDSDDSHTQ